MPRRAVTISVAAIPPVDRMTTRLGVQNPRELVKLDAQLLAFATPVEVFDPTARAPGVGVGFRLPGIIAAFTTRRCEEDPIGVQVVSVRV
jgi:hypothetical protein